MFCKTESKKRLLFSPLIFGFILATYVPACLAVTLNAQDYVSGGSGTEIDPWVGLEGGGGIKEAINALPVEGGTVYAIDGYYLITSPIGVLNNCTIEGQSWNTVLKRDIVTAYTQVIVMNNNTTIRNFTIDGDRYNQTINIEAVKIHQRNTVLVDNINFYNIESYGVILYSNTSDVTVQNSLFESCLKGVGFDNISDLSNITVRNNRFTGEFSLATQYNICSNTSNLLIEGNWVDKYRVRAFGQSKVSNYTVRNNVILGAADDIIGWSPAIHVEGDVNNITITGNEISNPMDRGISLTLGVHDAVIAGNYFHNIGNNAIAITTDVHDVNIENNLIESTSVGIYGYDNLDNIVVRKNEISSGSYGIRIIGSNGTSDNWNIEDNYIHNTGNTASISMSHVADCIFFKNNKIINNIGGGIALSRDSLAYVEAVNNIFAGNGAGGISIIGAGPIMILHNTVSSNTGNGIYFEGATGQLKYNIVVNNTDTGIMGISSSSVDNNYNIMADNLTNYTGVTPGPNTIFIAPAFRGTDYYSLAYSSQAIDHAFGSEIDRDYDGDPRPLDGLGDDSKIPDIGADEYGSYKVKVSAAGGAYIADNDGDDLGDIITGDVGLLKVGDEESINELTEHRAILAFNCSDIDDTEIKAATLHIYLDNIQNCDLQDLNLSIVNRTYNDPVTDANLYEALSLTNYGTIIPSGGSVGWYNVNITEAIKSDADNKLIFRVQLSDEQSIPNGNDVNDLFEIRDTDFVDVSDEFAPYIQFDLVGLCTEPPVGDLNKDCIVNLLDFSI